jgi:ribosomal protein S18 acetylase RimI-like enzyme
LRPCDFERLFEIDQSCFEPEVAYSRSELSWYLRRSGAVARVAEISGQIAGFVVGNSDPRGIAHVVTLDVAAGARRMGVGTRLMEALHDEFSGRKCRISILEVSMENSGAIRFYEGLGYERGDVLAGYYNGRIDALRMFLLFSRHR